MRRRMIGSFCGKLRPPAVNRFNTFILEFGQTFENRIEVGQHEAKKSTAA